MPPRVRKPIQDMIEELRNWLPNYDHGPGSYPELVWRLLASVPGGEQAEDMGFEPFQAIAWHEFDQIGRMISVIQDKQDVEDLVAGLSREEGEYEVVVGNLGTVYQGQDEQEARDAYAEYVKQSKSGKGRAGGETVTLFRDGEPFEEYEGGGLPTTSEARRPHPHRPLARPHRPLARPLPRNAPPQRPLQARRRAVRGRR